MSVGSQCLFTFQGLQGAVQGCDLRDLAVRAKFSVDSERANTVEKVAKPPGVDASGHVHATVTYPSMFEIWPEVYDMSSIRVIEVCLFRPVDALLYVRVLFFLCVVLSSDGTLQRGLPYSSDWPWFSRSNTERPPPVFLTSYVFGRKFDAWLPMVHPGLFLKLEIRRTDIDGCGGFIILKIVFFFLANRRWTWCSKFGHWMGRSSTRDPRSRYGRADGFSVWVCFVDRSPLNMFVTIAVKLLRP